MTRALHVTIAVVALVGALGLSGRWAMAQAIEGPSVTVEPAQMSPGDNVVVSLTGWRTNVVTLSVCGNLAARGSSDCNIVASEGIGLLRDSPISRRDFVVYAPPTTCPCVLRAASTDSDEVATAPIDLIGHPMGPIVRSASFEPIEVSLTSRRAPHGVIANLRSWVGGPTGYDVTVSVRNRSTETLEHVVLAGSAGRGRTDDVTALAIPPVGALAPGQTWEHTFRATVPAPVLGGFVWQVTASGAGPSVSAVDTTTSLPLGFILLAVMFVIDVGAMVWRRLARRRHQQGADADRGVNASAAVVATSPTDGAPLLT
ncbi:MAG: hypothetical protein ACRDZU_02065 [Acidimicrobiales bacterium]